MLSYDKLETAVLNFVMESKQEFFDAEELSCALEPQASAEEQETILRRVCGILDSCEFVARKHGSDLYYILNRFFQKTVFYCKPREIELEKGILIPGSRLEPFHPAELYPTELEIFRKHRKTAFGLTEVKLRYGEVADLFFMLGPAGTMDMLTAESQENYENMRKAGGIRDSLQIELEVFDFSEFYQETGFRLGDLLRFEIDSWADGKFTVAHLSRVDSPTPKEVGVWIEKFENALTNVCIDYKDSLEIHEQLMYAYVYAAASGNDVRRLPGPAVDLYPTQMQNISFHRNDAEWTLVPNDSSDDSFTEPEIPHEHEHEHEHEAPHADGCSCCSGKTPKTETAGLTPEDFTVSQGSMDSMEAILSQIHAPVCEIEVQSYMLDTIANGAESFDEFMRVHEELFQYVFTDAAQETAYLNFAEEFWELIFEHYSHNIDSRKAPLRARLLELTDSRIELSAAVLARKNSTLPADWKAEMIKIHRDILDTLSILCRDAVLEEDELENLELRVGDLEDDYEQISDKIMDWIEHQIVK